MVENAPGWARLPNAKVHKAVGLECRYDVGKCARFSEEASFSSSLKGLFVVQGFRVAGWLRGLRVQRGF